LKSALIAVGKDLRNN